MQGRHKNTGSVNNRNMIFIYWMHLLDATELKNCRDVFSVITSLEPCFLARVMGLPTDVSLADAEIDTHLEDW